MKKYDHIKIEKKWQEQWEKDKLFVADLNSSKEKLYVLDMFPYPSGEGLHVGHPKGYIATDIYSRYKKMSGFEIMHPMGWDAFGLPAENFAIKQKVHPRVAVETNIRNYRKQLDQLGFNYDWSREVNTTDPKFYKWTQWMFLKMLEKGLAYESHEPINWCPSCQTGLANEDVEHDGTCERCESVVEKKPMRQWVLKITDYADRLLEDLESLPEWPEHIKEAQRNWIGKSEGAELEFAIKESNERIKVFTTRPDTLFGATYMVLAPEHELVGTFKKHITNWDEVLQYIEVSINKSEIDRTAEGKEKTGVELKGIKAINPGNNEEIPVFIADYVLVGYGTGAIMAVPAHDARDFEFAKNFNLLINRVITLSQANDVDVFTGSGTLINSGKFDGLDSEEAKEKITKAIGGKLKTTYRLRDWVFSRQRYWGEPIPIIHCSKCNAVPVPENELPVELPEVKSYEPTGTGESPLASIDNWVNVPCPICGGAGKRETNTMPQWAGSSWYYLRFLDPDNEKAPLDQQLEKKWMPVDVYVGGDHAVRHLIYARFWHKFLFDIGIVHTIEPFTRLEFLGFILAEDGKKMSKRWGNIINPDDIVKQVGADTLRVYEMFMGPFENTIAWSTNSLIGSRRFLERVWRLQEKIGENGLEEVKSLHKTIKKVGEDIEKFKFNTAVSQLMILLNEIDDNEAISKKLYESFLVLLAPFVPHITEQLWHDLGYNTSIHLEKWPAFDAALLVEDTWYVAIQVNGKVRDVLECPALISESDITAQALKRSKVKQWLGDQKIVKKIYITGRLLNIVTTSK